MINLLQLLNLNGYKINLVYLLGGIIVHTFMLLYLYGCIVGLVEWIKERRGL
jgi:hypothetical protein